MKLPALVLSIVMASATACSLTGSMMGGGSSSTSSNSTAGGSAGGNASSADSGDAGRNFKSLRRKHGDAFRTAKLIAIGRYAGDDLAAIATQLQSLSALDSECKGVTAPQNASVKNYERRPFACELVNGRVALFSKYVVAQADHEFAQAMKSLRATGKVEGVLLRVMSGTDSKFMTLAKGIRKGFGILGAPVTEEAQRIIPDPEVVRNLVAVAAGKWNVHAFQHNKTVEAAMRKHLRKYPEKLVSIFIYNAKGVVEKSRRPPYPIIRKTWEGQVVMQAKDQTFCRVYTIKADAKYQGGRYRSVVGYGRSGNWRASKCRK